MGALLGRPKNFDEPDPATGLTPREKLAVKDSWARVQPDMRATGVAILIAFFEEHPKYLQLFSAFKAVPVDDLRTSKKFAAHASSVMHAISAVVDALDDTECLVELLGKIGKNHAKHQVPAQAFTDLKVIILKLLKAKLGRHLSVKDEEAWDKTLTVAMSVIQKQLPDGAK